MALRVLGGYWRHSLFALRIFLVVFCPVIWTSHIMILLHSFCVKITHLQDISHMWRKPQIYGSILQCKHLSNMFVFVLLQLQLFSINVCGIDFQFYPRYYNKHLISNSQVGIPVAMRMQYSGRLLWVKPGRQMADSLVVTSRISGFANVISVWNYLAEIEVGFLLPRNEDHKPQINLRDCICIKYKCLNEICLFSFKETIT